MPPTSPQALRLTFAWRGPHVSLVDAERVAMVVPGSIGEPASPDSTGYAFALLDANGRVIYRRPLHKPIRTDAESFSPGEGSEIVRVPLPDQEGRFTILVPDVDDAHTFQLTGPADLGQPDKPARELLRLDVDVLRRSVKPSGSAPPTPGRGPKG